MSAPTATTSPSRRTQRVLLPDVLSLFGLRDIQWAALIKPFAAPQLTIAPVGGKWERR